MKLFFEILRDIGFSKSLFGVLVVLGLALTPPIVLAQEEVQQEDEIASEEVPVEEEATPVAPSPAIEEVVVTGSRLKRDTFTSIAPLQIITGEVSREAGLMDAAEILQESTAASGTQIDLTFQGFVLDNGPGASTVNLRGLSDARTLVLVNGRRLSPAGVEGAPTSPDLNLIPASLVQQYELLLDGASSVYGSDAVAGVANVILRKDFDGFEFESYSSLPTHGAGDQHTLSFTWGRNFDRGFIGVGAEYSESQPVTLDDRPWTRGCQKHAEIDENGRVRSLGLGDQVNFGMKASECVGRSWVARVFQDHPALRTGSIYHTPGYSNGGWGNFSEGHTPWFGVDGNGDGVTDFSYIDYSLNGKEQFAHLYPEVTQSSVMAYGEYTLEGDMNLTPYFEALWSERDFYSNAGAAAISPDVPANNPFNLCNPNAVNGVDCGLAQDAMYANPNFLNQFENLFGGFCSSFGLSPLGCLGAFGFLSGPIGPAPTAPIVSIRGDRNEVDVLIDQFRIVTGVSGDLPFFNVGSLFDWSFDLSLSYTKASGEASRRGIREDRNDLALGVFSTTNTPCENDTGEVLAFDVEAGCLPVNWFAPSLYPTDTLIGDFETQAERDYLFDSRDFKTEYEQTLLTFFMSGDLYELPAGAIAGGIGFEWRKDEITSIPDHVASEGLMWGFFADGGALGDKVTKEAFAEVEIPLLAGMLLAEELTVNLSTRLTDDEYYGSAWTESFKVAYRPFNSLLLRATYGTSYRAPNLRELFLRYQTGFLSLFDPCFLPEGAIDDLTGEYNPAIDGRPDFLLENCRANGVDPLLANNNGFNTYSMELAESGTLDLEEETSESHTLGFAWEQPFSNEFELAVGATLYEIELKNTIIEPSGQYIINDCYYSVTRASRFCERIRRDLSDPTQPFIEFIDQAFVNRDSEKVKGVDVNATFADTLTVFNRPIDLRIDFAAHRLLERSTLFVDDDGDPDADTFEGEWRYPHWKFQLGARLDWDRWRLSWQANYIDGMKIDERGFEDFNDVGGSAQATTCLGPPDDVLCRDISSASDYMIHSASLYYRADWWTIGIGARNLLDEEPPFVDGSEVFSVNNTPLGAGYNLNGRTLFMNFTVNFGGGA